MVPAAVAHLVEHPDEWRALEAAAARAGRPRAALAIADTVLSRVAPRQVLPRSAGEHASIV
jgi:hypothetical protein